MEMICKYTISQMLRQAQHDIRIANIFCCFCLFECHPEPVEGSSISNIYQDISR